MCEWRTLNQVFTAYDKEHTIRDLLVLDNQKPAAFIDKYNTGIGCVKTELHDLYIDLIQIFNKLVFSNILIFLSSRRVVA